MTRRLLIGLIACVALLLTEPVSAKKPKPAPKGEAGSVRVYRFDNLDVEGRVKAPQLMYFLKRIRSKFRSFRLPRQNFSKKIIESQEADFL